MALPGNGDPFSLRSRSTVRHSCEFKPFLAANFKLVNATMGIFLKKKQETRYVVAKGISFI